MNFLLLYATLFCISTAVLAAPFSGWLFGGRQNDESATTEPRPKLFEKVQQFGERVYEKKREFLNGVNEKVSNLLWIPPLYTTTEPTPILHDHQKYTEMDSDEDEIPNVEIYARSSFLSPEDLVNVEVPPVKDTPTITYNINKNFNILGRIWA